MQLNDPACRVSFQDWTGGRDVRSIGTNAGTEAIAFQGWRRFKEAFAPEIVERAMTETRGTVARVVDPFGGSGTTALAAQFLGARPVTIEVNPFLADLIEAKLGHYDLDSLVLAFARIMKQVQQDRAVAPRIIAGMPRTMVEPGVEGRFIFSRKVFNQIHRFRSAIADLKDDTHKRFFRVHLAATLVPCSNVLVSGKGRRYRSNWGDSPIAPQMMVELFEQGVVSALFDLRRYEARKCRDYTLLRGDSRKLISRVGPLDVAVFSPPYPNSFDYTDVYNVELWALGYLDGVECNRALRNATLRSHVQIKRDLATRFTTSATLKRVVNRLNRERDNLWNGDIPQMVAAYTDDMHLIMRRLHGRIRSYGRVYMVVGDSRYNGIDVPVAKILCEEAVSIGYRIRSWEESRSMRASPQQGGQKVLSESLLILEKR